MNRRAFLVGATSFALPVAAEAKSRGRKRRIERRREYLRQQRRQQQRQQQQQRYQQQRQPQRSIRSGGVEFKPFGASLWTATKLTVGTTILLNDGRLCLVKYHLDGGSVCWPL